MRRLFLTLPLALALVLATAAPLWPASPEQASFQVLALYSTNVESDHVDFSRDALAFLSSIAARDHFNLTPMTDWDELADANLKRFDLVLWLNDSPHTAAQRAGFESYMTHGGAWMGFHAAGYNDSSTGWPWYVDFLGGAVFYSNSWPPLPAKLVIDDRTHPVMEGLPASFVSPANEWYIWRPSPRLNTNIKVLATLAPENYPLGLKDVLTSGDLPVVWTNTKFHMIYMNMGHGNKIMTDAVQNRLIENSILWLGSSSKHP